ncbi:synaptotagmin-3-like [Argentina anserina]|uniref:synaptotagmin-3-like n=1 Tax=Argentina anserina TaxID=57926 RepID=UPI00217679C4|nr:synaptotagmin-3-like [Potentilla anserina]
MRHLYFIFEFTGFLIGFPIGLLLGFFIFIFSSKPKDVKDPDRKSLNDCDPNSLVDLFSEIPPWVKHPDFERIDWLNKALHDMWPYLDKGICKIIRNTAESIFAEYTGKYLINSIGFQSLNLGSLPPTIYGIRVHETNENELVVEPAIRWAGIPHITVVAKILSARLIVQLMDVQVFTTPRIILRPLVPTFPCFGNITLTLIDKPYVDFGLRVLGADVMAVPGFYQFVQDYIRKQVASLYLWPQTLNIPILQDSLSGTIKKPVGILDVKVLRAKKLLKMDIIGTSDPYVKIELTGDRLPPKKTSIKMRNLNPEWNEDFKLTVKDPESQFIQFHVFDWDQIGAHDSIGLQILPLKSLSPDNTQEFTLDLVKNTNPYDPQNKKRRGQLVVQLTYSPFIEESGSGRHNSGPSNGDRMVDRKKLGIKSRKRFMSFDMSSQLDAAGLLLVTVQGAEELESKLYENPNPYVLVRFSGEKRKTKMIKKTHRPYWNEEFQFVVEEATLKEKIRFEVKSKKRNLFAYRFRRKELLGYIDINFSDVVYNGRIRGQYNLINSKNGVLHVELHWSTT